MIDFILSVIERVTGRCLDWDGNGRWFVRANRDGGVHWTLEEIG